MAVILNSLNTHNLPILQPILMILVSKVMVHRAVRFKCILLVPNRRPRFTYIV